MKESLIPLLLIIVGMEEQPFPEESKCPECGGEPSEDSKQRKRLQNLGYLAQDVFPECEDCGNQWKCGIPIGEYEEGDDLWCDSCDSEWMYPHFIKLLERAGHRRYKLNLKCPNDSCFHYKTIHRDADNSGKAMMGYPPITGTMEGSEPVGRPE